MANNTENVTEAALFQPRLTLPQSLFVRVLFYTFLCASVLLISCLVFITTTVTVFIRDVILVLYVSLTQKGRKRERKREREHIKTIIAESQTLHLLKITSAHIRHNSIQIEFNSQQIFDRCHRCFRRRCQRHHRRC